MIGLHFSQFTQEFWHLDDPARRKCNASAAGRFWEQ
jgi:hypothetical protein